MVSTHLLISNSSCPLSNSSVTVSRAPIIIGMSVTFMFYSFFQLLCKVKIVVLLFSFLQFYSMVSGDCKVQNFVSSLSLLIIIRSGRLAKIGWSVCMSKFHWSLCVSFSGTHAGLCINHLFVWSYLNCFHNSKWIIICCVWYSTDFDFAFYLKRWFFVSLLLLLLLLIRIFHISVSWWSFTGDWVTASRLKSPGLFSVF